jgi:protease YdgD
MKCSALPSRSLCFLVIALSALIATTLTAQSQILALTQISQVQPTIAEKIQAFGLTPTPEPFIPANLDQSRDPQGSRGTIGLRDDRVPMTSQQYPWSAIGRLEYPIEGDRIGICTGSLVVPDVVLTNAHCVVNRETHEVIANITFKPNLINGRVANDADIANVVDVIYGTDFRDSDAVPHPNDWAFVKLDRPLGETYGTLAWTSLPVSDLLRTYDRELILAGYSGDFPADAPGRTAGVHDGCSILGEADGSLLHDCDTFGGSSGGPILAIIDGEFRIVALNSAERSEAAVNPTTGEIIAQESIINYGVKIAPIVNFLSQTPE